MAGDRERAEERKTWLMGKVLDLFPGARNVAPFDGGTDPQFWILRFEVGAEIREAKFPRSLLEDEDDTTPQLEAILRQARVVLYPPKRK